MARIKRTPITDMIHSFTAIDFETAQPKQHSICQVGIVRVEHGIVVASYDQLVYPPDNFYWDRFSDIHGITPYDTRLAPIFPDIWDDIKHFLDGQHVVAHNGAFDFSVLAKTLDFYGMKGVPYTQHCTYKIYKKKLNVLCSEHGIALNHHDALSDANACAELFKRHLAEV